jgi:rSAM-associated Gly-rich repeat protein
MRKLSKCTSPGVDFTARAARSQLPILGPSDFHRPSDFPKMPAKVVEAWFRRWYIAPTILLPPGKRMTIMAHSHRRQFLKDLLGTLAQGAGTIVLASAATAPALAHAISGQDTDIQKRAEELAGAAGANVEDVRIAFVNRAFRNGYGGGFRNGGFRNGGVGGGFRNGGFRNGYGGGFRNGAFRNW